VEAPLTGGAIGAQNRSLVFMVGGDDEPVARCVPLLDKLGRATFHLGPVGAGTTMKLANSLLAFTCIWVSLEALSLAAAADLDLRTAIDVVRTGGASNFFMDRQVDGIDTRGRPPQFSLTLAAKDARLIEDLASDSGVPAPVAAAIRQVFADAVERGLGECDWSDLVLAAEARTGLDLTLGPAPDAGEGAA
jgi:3-hydroxyisobutyrate dehydrogenase-like beta-hydroxyacid dehydrogenase